MKKSLFRAADQSDVLERLRKLQPTSQRQWGKMTAHQMICHLSDSFRMPLGDIATSMRSNLLQRTLLKWIALQVPLPWPKGVKTMPQADQELDGTKPVEFARDRQELERLVERFIHRDRDFQWQMHPLFGEMSDEEWLRWGYLHLDHHLRQFGL